MYIRNCFQFDFQTLDLNLNIISFDTKYVNIGKLGWSENEWK